MKWPRRSGVATRLVMRIPKVDMRNVARTRYALYTRPSDLRRNVPVGTDPTVGEGLFSHYGYHRGDKITIFVGVIMTAEEYEADVLATNSAGYCVRLSRNRVLQSHYARFNRISSTLSIDSGGGSVVSSFVTSSPSPSTSSSKSKSSSSIDASVLGRFAPLAVDNAALVSSKRVRVGRRRNFLHSIHIRGLGYGRRIAHFELWI